MRGHREVPILISDIDETLRGSPWLRPPSQIDREPAYPAAATLLGRIAREAPHVPLVFLTGGTTSVASGNARFLRRLLSPSVGGDRQRWVLLLSRAEDEALRPNGLARVHSGHFKRAVLRLLRAALEGGTHNVIRRRTLVCLGDDTSGDAPAYRAAGCLRGGDIRRAAVSPVRFYTPALAQRVLADLGVGAGSRTDSVRGAPGVHLLLQTICRYLERHGARLVDARIVRISRG